MDYIKSNKDAWEEVFEKHRDGYKKNPIIKQLDSDFAFLNNDMIDELKKIGFKNKNIAQFCCNNGRELLSIVKSGAKSGTGFDIAENFINEANRIAELKKINCNFVCTNILDIGKEYKNKFDLVFSTIGSLCWFKNLDDFFSKINLVLKSNGIFLISETHPFTNMISMEGEEGYDENYPEKIIYSYFKNDPWIDNNGMDYIGNTTYKSKTFTSFSHTLSEIINAMINNNIQIVKLKEYNHDLFGFSSLHNGLLPLSMILIGRKNSYCLKRKPQGH